jgi:hydrogenase maturation factor
MGNPAGLYRRGWKKEALKIGGTVVVSGSLAKDGSSLLNASTVTLDGKRLFAGSSGEEGYEGK